MHAHTGNVEALLTHIKILPLLRETAELLVLAAMEVF